jgi:thioredoxin reductase
MLKQKSLEWAVIGAGAAGIAAVGKLIDQGINPQQIGWIDPHFAVGDLGMKWSHVPSNTKVKLFNAYLENCKSFEYERRPKKFTLDQIDPEKTCLLQDIVEPLQWITDHLKTKVHARSDTALALNLSHGHWEIKTKGGSLFSKKVILAIGCEARNLSYPGLEVIPIEAALHPKKLAQSVQPQDTIAVFGSSHTAFLVLANLHELKAKTVNFYRSPHRYAVYFKDWILFDATGLKGFTADWARKHIDGALPPHLKRVLLSDHSFEESLGLCNKVIYATGFEKRKLPILEQFEGLHYDDKTGLIAPNLFGIGIAFPQAKFNRLGHLEHLVGLWKFMDYLNGILPIWLAS